MEIQEKASKEIKTVTASAQGYDLSATATIENGKITAMNGYVVNTTMTGMDNIRFDASRYNGELKANYYGVGEDDRATVDIFNELIDSVVAAYEK